MSFAAQPRNTDASRDLGATTPVAITLAGEINAAHAAVEAAGKITIENAIKCGRLLDQAKAQVPHGQWLGWIKSNCVFTPRTAQNYMKLAANAKRVSHLPVRDALAALAAPRPDLHADDDGDDAGIADQEPVAITWDDGKDMLPPLSSDEYRWLKDDIQRYGIRNPIEVDEDGLILDGLARANIARELGIEVPARIVTGFSSDPEEARIEKQRIRLDRQLQRKNLSADEVAERKRVLDATPEDRKRMIREIIARNRARGGVPA